MMARTVEDTKIDTNFLTHLFSTHSILFFAKNTPKFYKHEIAGINETKNLSKENGWHGKKNKIERESGYT